MKFVIESSTTPIYNRIALSIVSTFKKLGHEVYFIDPTNFNNETFTNAINSIEFDYYISTNDNNFINNFDPTTGKYLIENIKKNIVSIHHDSSFYKPSSIQEIQGYLEVLRHHSDHIFHFFIEKSNKINFENFGIKNCFEIKHASEFTPKSSVIRDFQHDISFVGHLMSGLSAYPTESLQAGHHILSLAWQRASQATFQIQPAIWALLNNPFFKTKFSTTNLQSLAVFQFLMHEVNKLSMAYRGELLGKINDFSIAIYGGDPSYGKFDNPLMRIKKDNIQYFPATTDYRLTQSIYQRSKINVNLSSLQFDTAINNRIIDIVMSGGFVVTDKRSSLIEACPATSEVSFDSPEEMQYLIEYYMHPANYQKYRKIKDAVFHEVKDQFTYERVVAEMIKQLQAVQ
jgi:hypothetical protein